MLQPIRSARPFRLLPGGLFCALATLLQAQVSQTLELQPTADARIGTSLGTDGASQYLSVFQNASQVQAAVLQFNTATLPARHVVAQATLRLYADASLYFGGNPAGLPIEVYRLTQPWTESQVSWDQREAGSPWANAGGDFVGTSDQRGAAAYAAASPALTNSYASPGLVTWDVTTLVREWVTGAHPNNGLLLASHPGNSLHFRSRESGTFGPTLSVRLEPAPTVTTMAPDSLQPGGARLQATLDLNGGSGSLRFLLGRTTDYTFATEPVRVETNGSVTVSIQSLAPATAYHVQAVLTTPAGTFRGADVAFSTPTGAGTLLSSLLLDAAPLAPTFLQEVLEYHAEIDPSVGVVSISPVVPEPGQSVAVRINGGAFANVASGAYSPPLPVAAGTNRIEIKVTASDGVASTIYGILVARTPVLGWMTLAGLPGTTGSTNGVSTAARFNNPASLTVDADGFVYVADQGNFTVRRISPAGEVVTLAGVPGASGTNDGPGGLAKFLLPQGIAVGEAGAVYVADTGNHTVRKLTRTGATWTVSTVAGSPGAAGVQDGAGVFSRFNQPMGIAYDAVGNVLYVADMGNHAIRRVTLDGVVTTLAGELGVRGNNNGSGPSAHFNSPQGVALDASGSVIVADTGNSTIRRIAPGGVVTTVAGLAGNGGNIDGPIAIARFNSPAAVAVDRTGSIVVADNLSHTLRRITSGGVVATMVGVAGASGIRDGVGTAARFNRPTSVAVDAAGSIYVADSWNHTVRKAAQGLVCSEDFEGTVGPEWSVRTVGTTPTGGRKFLGEFANNTVTLTLTNLPPHQAVRIALDLFIIRTWDGSVGFSSGGDVWSLSLGTGETLINTTFANASGYLLQAYPGTYPGALNRWSTGAAEVNSLGFLFNSAVSDSVYHIETVVPHATNSIQVRVRGSGLQALTDESWGVDNVRVTLLDAPAGVLTVAPASLAVREDATNAVVSVVRLGDASLAAAVDWTTEGGSAVPGSDFVASSGRLAFAPGQTNAVIVVPLINDAIAEPTKVFTVRLSNPSQNLLPATTAATVQINDDDGFVEVAQTDVVMRENDYGFSFAIRWFGATNEPVIAALRSVNGTASDAGDFFGVNTTVLFNPGETNRSVFVFLKDDTAVEGDQSFRLRLEGASQSANLDSRNETTVLLLDNDKAGVPGEGPNSTVQSLAAQRDGRLLVSGFFDYASGLGRTSLARYNTNGLIDATFAPATGSSFWIENVSLQADGKILIGGSFTDVGGQARNRVARLTTTGALDTTFAPAGGANNTVLRVLSTATNKVLISGLFTTVNGVARNRIARLNNDGSLDTTFDPGTGANGSITSLAEQTDGRVIVGGTFTTFNSTNRVRLARLDANGVLDATFNAGTGLNAAANVILALPDDKLLVGGNFTTNNGVATTRLMRLNPDGSPDPTFSVGAGPNANVVSLAVQPDGRILAGGDFSTWTGLSLGNVVRLNTNGTLDTSFVLGPGANGSVRGLAALADGRVALGGAFTVFNGATRMRFAIVPGDAVLPDEPVSWVAWPTNSGGNGHYYALTRRAQGWTNAEAEAVSWGGHLATVNDAPEQQFIDTTFLKGLNRLRPLWIGLSDAGNEGSFVWADTAALSYTNWDNGEPNNNSNEDFVVLNWGYSYTVGGQVGLFSKWNDVRADGSPGSQATGPYYGVMESASDPLLPRILTPPISRTVLEGDTVTLGVDVAGPGSRSYQWRKDGADIGSATNATLMISPARTEDTGRYSVRVSNFEGTVTSADALLNVIAAPTLSASQLRWQIDGSLVLRLDVTPGLRVVVETSGDLRVWVPLADQVAVTPTLEIRDPEAATAPVRYYRLKLIL